MSRATVTIHGFLGKDAELKYLPSGTAVSNFSVATSRKSKNAQGEQTEITQWFECAVYGDTAEKLSPYLLKGTSVMVIGDLNLDTYTTREGDVRISAKVNSQIIDLGPKPGERSEGEAQPQRQQTTRQQRPADDIPF